MAFAVILQQELCAPGAQHVSPVQPHIGRMAKIIQVLNSVSRGADSCAAHPTWGKAAGSAVGAVNCSVWSQRELLLLLFPQGY